MVKIVEEELKIEVNEDMRAANMTASIIPLAPVGISSVTSLTNAMLVHPLLLPQILSHSGIKTQYSFHTKASKLTIGVCTTNFIFKQNSCCHSRKNHDEKWEKLQVSGKNACTLGMTHVLGGKSSLYNNLIRTPVPDGGDSKAKCHTRPGQVRLAWK